jgi:solute:Na+ symporter, SSS family
VALAMIRVKSVLDVWWDLAGVFGGGLLGLFLLGFISRRTTNAAAAIGTGAGVALILWMTFSKQRPEWFGGWASPFHNLLVIVFGTLTIVLLGFSIALSRTNRPPKSKVS